ncbi:hypothetical protein [Halomonas heilongjiangensis]|uniref:Uncharacterized protein n=1 Tax=Halomonas heilongjiangensis TaxID=1387883 RepID=A0A2N7TGT9_9GAMM|nr:hypothetical protein [Halomonas heilongjiangensis]PMR67396.1 hypothetical protein C1H66_19790 [Halomonas heilongjiangensis]PXX91154.1 hypothetical protein CR158_08300 [Halomonas heilongjiangensis]
MNALRTSLVMLGLGAALALGGVARVEAQRAAAGPPDWPCVQRLIPELAWGTIWTGPSLDELQQDWWDDEEVGRVVRFATARSTPEGEALERVRDFVASVDGGEAEERLTLLFAGLFELTDRERRRAIDSIRRASRAQVARLDDISAMVDELEALRDDEQSNEAEVERLSETLFWEERTFERRQQALPAMCDQPALLEEKLSRMTRVIKERMP